MIYEIAEINVTPGSEAQFEAAVAEASVQFKNAEGCYSLRLEKVIEEPSQYHLVVGWETVAHHMVTFRDSEGFQIWRKLASPFFAAAPKVVHVHCVLDCF